MRKTTLGKARMLPDIRRQGAGNVAPSTCPDSGPEPRRPKLEPNCSMNNAYAYNCISHPIKQTPALQPPTTGAHANPSPLTPQLAASGADAHSQHRRRNGAGGGGGA